MNAFRFNGARRRMDLLPPDRPVRIHRAANMTRPVDIVDADFETVPAGSRRNVYPVFNDNRRPAPSRTPSRSRDSMIATAFTLALGRFERLLQAASPKGFAILVTCLCAPVFLLFASLSPHQPASASAPALSLAGVTTSLNDADGMKVLSVFGAIENHSPRVEPAPIVLVDVIAGGQRRTVSRISSGETVLQPGESRSFSTRLLHTGGKLPEVAVSLDMASD
ncbi:hypothetical protein [Rhizobium sp. Root482]|uniref:hypothetical protein n=1 Tax=Rhizobium sp. Root482 TaxID=1736543 RepID=UPI0006F90839|nr:hypothetical protein [Rhizobium sp. Root482]KQY12239.1 hypothetical protein ASD31_16840 [Rhizobium sp. Root482]